MIETLRKVSSDQLTVGVIITPEQWEELQMETTYPDLDLSGPVPKCCGLLLMRTSAKGASPSLPRWVDLR